MIRCLVDVIQREPLGPSKSRDISYLLLRIIAQFCDLYSVSTSKTKSYEADTAVIRDRLDLKAMGMNRSK